MQKKPTYLKLLVSLTAIALSAVLLWSCNNAADSTTEKPAAATTDSPMVTPKVADTLQVVDTIPPPPPPPPPPPAPPPPPDPGKKKT